MVITFDTGSCRPEKKWCIRHQEDGRRQGRGTGWLVLIIAQKKRTPEEVRSFEFWCPTRRCREHFCIARLRANPKGEPQGCGEFIEPSINGFNAQKCKNPPEAGSLNMVPEPGQKCREHFCIARPRANPKGEPQGCGEFIEPSINGFNAQKCKNPPEAGSLKMVPEPGIEPGTRGFSIPCSTD